MAGNEAALSNAVTPTADTNSGNRDAVANDKGQWFIRALALVRSGADWETIGACYGNNRFEVSCFIRLSSHLATIAVMCSSVAHP